MGRLKLGRISSRRAGRSVWGVPTADEVVALMRKIPIDPTITDEKVLEIAWRIRHGDAWTAPLPQLSTMTADSADAIAHAVRVEGLEPTISEVDPTTGTRAVTFRLTMDDAQRSELIHVDVPTATYARAHMSMATVADLTLAQRAMRVTGWAAPTTMPADVMRDSYGVLWCRTWWKQADEIYAQPLPVIDDGATQGVLLDAVGRRYRAPHAHPVQLPDGQWQMCGLPLSVNDVGACATAGAVLVHALEVDCG